MLRMFRPDIVLATAVYDRHPDHGRAATLVEEAFFKSGLAKIKTHDDEGSQQQPWKPKRLYHYMQSVSIEPDFLVDISDVMETKMQAIRAYKTQFYDPKSKEPETFISNPAFLDMIESRARELGHRIGVNYAEGFITRQIIGTGDLFHLK